MGSVFERIGMWVVCISSFGIFLYIVIRKIIYENLPTTYEKQKKTIKTLGVRNQYWKEQALTEYERRKMTENKVKELEEKREIFDRDSFAFWRAEDELSRLHDHHIRMLNNIKDSFKWAEEETIKQLRRENEELKMQLEEKETLCVERKEEKKILACKKARTHYPKTCLTAEAFIQEEIQARKKIEEENSKKCDDCIFIRSMQDLNNGNFICYYCGLVEDGKDIYSTFHLPDSKAWQAVYGTDSCLKKVTEEMVKKSIIEKSSDFSKK